MEEMAFSLPLTLLVPSLSYLYSLFLLTHRHKIMGQHYHRHSPYTPLGLVPLTSLITRLRGIHHAPSSPVESPSGLWLQVHMAMLTAPAVNLGDLL